MGYKLAIAAVPTEVASGTPPVTLLQLVAATNIPIYVYEIHVGLDATVEITVQLRKQTSAGTMTSLTPKKLGSYSETLQTTAQHTSTSEPTGGDEVARAKGNRGVDFLFPSDKPLIIAGGERLGIILASADSAVNCIAYARFEE